MKNTRVLDLIETFVSPPLYFGAASTPVSVRYILLVQEEAAVVRGSPDRYPCLLRTLHFHHALCCCGCQTCLLSKILRVFPHDHFITTYPRVRGGGGGEISFLFKLNKTLFVVSLDLNNKKIHSAGIEII